MPDFTALKSELLAGHPDTGAYNANSIVAAAELNTVNRTVNRLLMTGSEVAQSIVSSEFNALDASTQQRVWDVLHLGELNPFGVEATLLTAAFGGGGSATITALAAARKRPVSRAEEIGLGIIEPGHVEFARNL